MTGEWMHFDRWHECGKLGEPASVFEVMNSDGQTMFTTCVERLGVPWDWKSAPIRFRLVTPPRARHSGPIPRPAPSEKPAK
jgi:hypothetical protein